jgi:hypothetical protein
MFSLPPKTSFIVVTTSILACIYTYVINADIFSVARNQFQFYLVTICLLYALKKENIVKDK